MADLLARPSHQIVLDANQVLVSMEHRGACGREDNTGDGAGILTGLPRAFISRIARDEFGRHVSTEQLLGVGNIFLPNDSDERAHCKRYFERTVRAFGQACVGWRTVPVDPHAADLGEGARSCMPVIEQMIVAPAAGIDERAFERKLYLIRKVAGNRLRADARLRESHLVYACSLSCRVIVYKGMLTPGQLLPFFPDLADWEYKTHLAMVHSRFSTNTLPSWDRAQPLRLMAHNGEINTVRGNVNAMHDREGIVSSPLFGNDIDKLFPVAEANGSDSASFDNVLEFLVLGGRSLPSSVMMMIPEAWQKDTAMSEQKRAYYEFHSAMMEPWDGPASISFTDGKVIGAVLDRNGLRPSRYYVTRDHRIIMASEVGVVPVAPEHVLSKGRLKPGRMLLVDFDEQRVVPDDEIKTTIANKNPYPRWLSEQKIQLSDLPPGKNPSGFYPDTLVARMRAFGYSTETLQFQLVPMIREKRDPLGSMGNDAALAVLSEKPRLLYDYFKQLFAQVTNPPIDSIREEVVMSLHGYMGPEGNLLDVTEKHGNRILVPHPIITNEELAALRDMDFRGYRSKVIDTTWPRKRGAAGIDVSLRRIAEEAERAVDDGYRVIILSDRGCADSRVPLSALLAASSVHQHLVRVSKRTRVGLVIETGEAREVHHHCLLVGYGADAINPYLAFEALWQARRDKQISASEFPDDASIVAGYRKAVAKGMLKVMAKMGISTLQSYKGAMIFEAVGLSQSVIDQCFTGTLSRIGGIGFDVIAEEHVRRHDKGYANRGSVGLPVLSNDGQYHFRTRGEKHMWTPTAVSSLQVAARQNSREAYKRFSDHANHDAKTRCTLRGLISFRETTPIDLQEVEPASEIVKRFATGAMSFGSISEEAHTTLAQAMNRIGAKSNTGEGGEDPARYGMLEDGTVNPMRSAIKQVASGRFGVTISYLSNADEIQIKMAQGAKPGEGGELPGRKVDEYIGQLRHSTPGVGLISPPPHHDIYSIEDLAQLIYDLKNANPKARISVKLVSAGGVGTIAAGVTKAHAEHILVSGHDGGTGASPLTSIKHAGLPWELGIAETHQTLVMNGLRNRVVLQTDGQLKTGRDVVIAALLGAQEFGFSTAPLIALGCIMMRKCHLNTCPVGIATQDKSLRKKFTGAPEHVINYLFMVAEEVRELMARLGFSTVEEMVGRVEVLRMRDMTGHWKAQHVDLTALLTPPEARMQKGVMEQPHGLEKSLDNRLIEMAMPELREGKRIRRTLDIRNTQRAVGTMLSHHLITSEFAQTIEDDQLHFHLVGTAGQSFGAWLTRGVTLRLEGDANDYVGKGLCGGRLVIYPPKRSSFASHENVIVGNVALYGATSGEAFISGRAAERFAVRNSGAKAVVEGVGDHGCEYMTGGVVVVLGETGRNFAAGMSGGFAYVWDPEQTFASRCNPEMVNLRTLQESGEIEEIRDLIRQHRDMTGSGIADLLLEAWPRTIRQFVKVSPRDYEIALEERRRKSMMPKLGAA